MRKIIEVSPDAHKWLMENRGAGSVKRLVDKIIEAYRKEKQ